MNGKEIAEQLIALVNANQCGIATMRALLSHLNDDNVVEFYETIHASEFAADVGMACARNGIIPHLAPGMVSPLALTDDQQEYADPAAANAYLSLQFTATASTPEAAKAAAEVAKMGTTAVPTVQPLGQYDGLIPVDPASPGTLVFDAAASTSTATEAIQTAENAEQKGEPL